MKPSISIVVRAYNEEKHIERLLTGIQQQTVSDVQTILVDSGSTDATVEIASKNGVEVVHIQPEEFTFGRSLNLGIGTAQGEKVVIASAHVYPVYPDWLEKLTAPLDDAGVALCYGKQRGTPSSQFSEHQIFHHWFPDHSTNRQPHPFCNNANAAIRRSLWQAHPYDEMIPALEDLAWARWAQSQGHSVAYSAEAEVCHVHEESWAGVFNRYRREGMAFKQLYPHERFRLSDLMRLWAVNVITDFKAASHQKVLVEHWLPILRFRWAQFSGTYQGYRQAGPLTMPLKRTFYYPRQTSEKPRPHQRGIKPIHYHDTPGKLPASGGTHDT